MILLEENTENLFQKIWGFIVRYYGYYSNFIHSIFPRQLGDLVEWVLNAAIAFILIKLVADVAFRSREN